MNQKTASLFRNPYHFNGLRLPLVTSLRESQPEILALLEQGTAFQQPWFRDIAAAGAGIAIPFATVDGAIAACLPYDVRWEKIMFPRANASSWLHISGPVFARDLDQSQKAEAIRKLIAQLPGWVDFKFTCNPGPHNFVIVDALKAAGFSHKSEVTYEEYPSDPDVMDPDNKSGLDKKRRGNIRRAEKRVTVTEDLTAQEFVNFYLRNLADNGRICYDDPSVMLQLIQTGQSLSLEGRYLSRQDGTQILPKRVILFAARETTQVVSEATALVAAIACVLDSARCYYWLSTRRCSDEYDDTIKALIIRARNRARQLGLIFDADGVVPGGTDKLYKLLKFPRLALRDTFFRRAVHDYRPEIKTWRMSLQNGIGAVFRHAAPQLACRKV